MSFFQNLGSSPPRPYHIFIAGILVLALILLYLGHQNELTSSMQKTGEQADLSTKTERLEFFGVVTTIGSNRVGVDRFYPAESNTMDAGEYKSSSLVLKKSAEIVRLSFNDAVRAPVSGTTTAMVQADEMRKPAEAQSYTSGPPLLAQTPATMSDIRIGSKVKILATADTIESIQILPDAFVIDPYALLNAQTTP